MNSNIIYDFSLADCEDGCGSRIDAFLAENLSGLSRSRITALIEEGFITVNGEAVKKKYKLNSTDVVKVVVPPPKEMNICPEDIPLEIVYEDEYLLVVNKPQGMVVHPAAGNYSGTLVNALMYRCGDSLSGINGVLRPGIVHRIDKDTAGLLVVAKCDFAHEALAAQLKEHSMVREYHALCMGKFRDSVGRIDLPIGRSSKNRKEMAVVPFGKGKNAVTNYTVVEEYKNTSYVKLRLETGRTHQIRVHLSYYNHPILGDPVYNKSKETYGLAGQCLVAKTLGFIHPKSGEMMEFSVELPKFFTDVQSKLR